MSLSDLAAVGSFVSGVAVVISFVFLALQIRQTNRNQKSLMQQGRSARNVDILLKLAEPAVSETVAQADRDCTAMDETKIWSFYGFAGAIFWTYEDSFLQFRANALDARSWESDVTIIKRLLAYPAYRVAWKMARDGLSGDYREYVDALMRQAKRDTTQTLTDLWKTYVSEELAA